MRPEALVLGRLFGGEQLVLGVLLAGVARLAVVGGMLGRAAVVVSSVGCKLVDALAVPAAVREHAGREAEGGH
jgi:hypothetical protein